MLYKNVQTCNVLIDFVDLRKSVEEVWDRFHPGNVALSAEEKMEVLQAFDAWIVRNGETFLQLHHHRHQAKLAAKALARVEALRTEDRVLALTQHVKPQTTETKTHFSVPFQKFRLWFMYTCSAIANHREQVVVLKKKKLHIKEIKA